MSTRSSVRLVRFTIVCIVFVLSLGASTLPVSVFAETLGGQVLDPQGKSVAGAQVRLFERNSGEMRSTRSTEDGAYSFPGLAAGNYLLEGDSSMGTLGGSMEVSVSGDQKLDLKLAVAGARTDVLVIASSSAQSVDEIAKAVDVLDSEEIAQRDEISIADSIRSLPGLRVQTLEGPGSLTSIRIRGLRSQDTAVLIDGVRFRDAASLQGDASAMFEDMGIIDTERVEVLRGSGSSLYGSHALGGVVNISSRPGGGPTHGQFLAEGGGLGMIRSVANIGGGLLKDRFTYSLGVSHINVTKGPRDGLPFRSSGTQTSLRYSISNKMSLSGRLWYSNSYLAVTESPTVTPEILANSADTGEVRAVALPIDQLKLFENLSPFDAGNATYIPNQIDPDARRKGKFYSGSLTFQHQLSANTSYQLAYQGVSTFRIYVDGPAGPGQFEPAEPTEGSFNGYTNVLQARIEHRLGRYNRISGGYEYERERYVNLNGSYGAPSASGSVRFRQRSSAFFVQDQIGLADGRLQITVAGRAQLFNLKVPKFAGFTSPYEDVAAVAPPTAYTADGAIAYFIRTTGTKFRGHVGNSFRAPSGYERFAGDSGFYYGDPTLRPERAIAVDGGIDQKLFGSKLTLSGTAFYTRLQQSIFFAGSLDAGDPYGRSFGYQNSGGGISRGAEFSAHLSPGSKTNIGLSYTYVNSDSNTPTIGTDYYKALGQSPRLVTATVSQWIGKRVSVSADMSAYSKYTISLSGAGERQFVFDGPVKADAVFHYDHPLANQRSAEFYVKVENLTNERSYENGFIGPKAWVVGGIRYKY